MTIILFLLVLGVLVFIHEAGHFTMAKLFGVRVDEFAIGFPPRLFSWKRGETEYSINLLPLGGYVKIFGEDGEAGSGPDQARSFVAQPKLKQGIILMAGIGANLILAWLLLAIAFNFGVPAAAGTFGPNTPLNNPQLTIIGVLTDSPAAESGLAIGDQITNLGVEHETLDKLTIENTQNFIASHPGGLLHVDYLRHGQVKSTAVKIGAAGKVVGDRPVIGVALDIVGSVKLPFFSALGQSLIVVGYETKATIHAFGNLIHDLVIGKGKTALQGVVGPVGLAGLIGDANQLGVGYLLTLVAFISINLAVVNSVPFPALDGGRLLMVIIEAIFRRPLPTRFVSIVNLTSLGLLLLFMVVVTYQDVLRLLIH